MNKPVVVVTGAGRGIGRQICLRFARDGARIVAVARTESELKTTQKLVRKTDSACEIVVADVADRASAALVARSALDHFGRIDVLVNNAGIAPSAELDRLDPDVFDAMIGVNVAAPYYLAAAVWPVMRSQASGVIVNISSVASVDPFPGFAAYGASKSFVNGLTVGLAREGKPHGIGVYGVAPGAVDTAMLRTPFPDFPTNQCLDPADIADVVYLTTQPSCKYMTGQTIFVSKT